MSSSGRGQCTYLVDDLTAELDKEHSKRVCEFLSSMKVQVFVTSIEQDDIRSAWPDCDDIQVFHVEHGVVSEERQAATSIPE